MFGLFNAHRLLIDTGGARVVKRQSVGLGKLFKPVARDCPSGPRHVLHENSRISRNMCRQVAGEHSTLNVHATAAGKTSDDANRLALEVDFLGKRIVCARCSSTRMGL
jgi:hypothetical protein